MSEPVEEPHVSWSQLSTLADCGVKYELTYVQNVPRAPQGPLIAGRAIHAAIEWAESQPAELKMMSSPAWVGARFIDLFEDDVNDEGGSDVIRWGGKKLIHTSVEYQRFAEHIKAHGPLYRPGGGFVPVQFKRADEGTAPY